MGRSILAVLTLAVLAGCTAPKADLAVGETPALDTPEGGLWMIMGKTERKLLSSGRVVPDQALQDYVRDISCTLSADYCDDLRVYVVRQPSFNASMAPNGFMTIWTGALLRTENEAQVATVIGHEMAHYIRRHSLARWEETQSTLNSMMVFRVVTAVVGLGLIGDLATIGALGHLASYSRDHEREADEMGFKMAAAAGYTPEEAPKIWSGLVAEKEAADKDDPDIFLASHPPSKERFETLANLAEAARNEGDGENTLNEDRFLLHVVPHRAAWLEDELDLGRFEQTQVLLDRLKASSVGLGVLWYYQGELLRRRGGEEDGPKAVEAYRQAQAYADAPASVHRALGLAHWEQADHEAARAAFARYLDVAPEAEDRAMIRTYMEELEGTI